ncbi:MAG: PAS domain S-box protein [Syntrophaceae bacterium]|nr:PAS domain S-box protein [Syntrophaceae bacterium]
MKHRFILAAIIITVGLSIYFFASFYNDAKQEAIKNVNNEQFIQARHAAHAIEDFFDNWTRIFVSMSKARSIVDFDETGKKYFEFLYEASSHKIRAITRVDAEGKIVYTYPFNAAVIGRNISRQKHIREIMTTHKPVISDVFFAVQGYDTVALHVPILHNNTYKGSIGITINFQALAKRYLEDIKIGNSGYAWMISRDGTELYCPVPGHTGHSVFENCKDFPSILIMAEDMLKGLQGSTTYTFDKIRGSQVENVTKHAVYMPIKLGNTFWSIVVASSEDEIIASLEDFRNKLFVVIGLLLLGGILFSYYGLRAWFFLEEEKKRHRAEEALRESEDKYRSLAETASDLILTIDFNGIITYANRATIQLAGGRNIVGMRVTDLIPPDTLAPQMEMLRERSQGYEGVRSYEWTLPLPDQAPTSMSLEIKSALLIDQGKPSGVLITARDITARKRAEEALRQSERNFRNLTEASTVGISITDGERFLYCNPEVLRMSGYSEEEYYSKPIWDFVTPESRDLIMHRGKDRLAGKTVPASYEIQVLTKDGGIRWAEVGAATIEYNGKPAIVFTQYDITDRKNAEAEREALQMRLNSARKMEALGQLAGGVAHDLNNILGIMSGYSELLLLEIPEGQRAREHVEKILKSTEKGANIIQDLLTLARRGVTTSDVINLNNIVSDFLKTPVFENVKFYHPRVTFKTECQDHLLNIKGSSVHLEKTLMNLVSNAAESISGEGEVLIRTENRYVDKAIKGYDEVREGDYVVLSVSDTGLGILPEDRDKIFEPFYTRKKMGRSGTGLGLAIVWGTVKDHNGYIDVRSKIGEGTTFTLYFPVTREEMTSTRQSIPMERYMGNGESVLVVDDIAEQRDIAAGLLAKLGYEVYTVSSGEAALTYLEGNKADILVLDMIMDPGIDGLETYQRIIRINPKQKAIIVSGFSETDRVRAAQQLGAGAYVRKPYVLEQIGLAIRDELARS